MKSRKFSGKNRYGIVILLCCMLITACSTGILSYLAALFVEPVTSSLHISRSSFMLYSTVGTVTTMVFMPVAGELYHRIRLKKLMLMGVLFGVGALLTYSLSKTVFGFYAGGLLSGLSMSFCGALPMTMVINNWFTDHRGTVTGIAFTGSALVSAALSPMISSVIEKSGYVTGYRILAAFYAVLMLGTVLLIRERPIGFAGEAGQTDETAGNLDEKGVSKAEALHSPAFWLFALTAALLGMVTFGTQSNLIAYWTFCGIEPIQAAGLYSAVMMTSAAAKLILGGLYDRIGMVKGSAVICIVGSLAMAGLVLITHGPALIVPAVLFGMLTSLQVILTSYGTASLFGKKNYSTLFGLINTFLFCGVSVGVPMTAAVYDMTGTYTPIWWIYCGVLLICMGLIWASSKLTRRFAFCRPAFQAEDRVHLPDGR